MKNMDYVWDLMILLLLMCAGVASASTLALANTKVIEYRFIDKSLESSYATSTYTLDPNTNEYIRPDFEIMSYTPYEVIATVYVQDYSCPYIDGVPMVISIYDYNMPVVENWAGYKNQHRINVTNILHTTDPEGDGIADINDPRTEYSLAWDIDSRRWSFVKRLSESYYDNTSGLWKWRDIY